MAFNHNTGWKSNALSKSLEDYGQDLLRELEDNRRSTEVSTPLSRKWRRLYLLLIFSRK